MIIHTTYKCPKCSNVLGAGFHQGNSTGFGPLAIQCHCCGTIIRLDDKLFEYELMSKSSKLKFMVYEYICCGIQAFLYLLPIAVLFFLIIPNPSLTNLAIDHIYLSFSIYVLISFIVAIPFFLKRQGDIKKRSKERVSDSDYIEMLEKAGLL